MDTPESNNTDVFNNGTWNACSVKIPVGGQIAPISTEGASLEWKYAQKNAKKKQTSDKINNIIPIFNPFITNLLWNPWYVDSRTTSRHHKNEINAVVNKPKINNEIFDERI